MNLTDEQYLDTVKNLIDVFPQLFISDTAFAITDKEKYVIVKQADTFKLNIEQDQAISKGGAADKSIITKKKETARYPKETFGFPIIVYSVPLINKCTGNAVGTLLFAVSQEKEQNVLNMSNEIQAFAEQMSATSQELAGASQELASSSQYMSDRISEISHSFKKLDGITNYVKTVADSTNLLGLNAAIEAARAGEAGKGFSVVAEEIRKLAQNSKDSSSQILSTLLEVKNSIAKMYEGISNFASISEGQADQTQQVAQGSQKMSELAAKLTELARNLQ